MRKWAWRLAECPSCVTNSKFRGKHAQAHFILPKKWRTSSCPLIFRLYFLQKRFKVKWETMREEGGQQKFGGWWEGQLWLRPSRLEDEGPQREEAWVLGPAYLRNQLPRRPLEVSRSSKVSDLRVQPARHTYEHFNGPNSYLKPSQIYVCKLGGSRIERALIWLASKRWLKWIFYANGSRSSRLRIRP